MKPKVSVNLYDNFFTELGSVYMDNIVVNYLVTVYLYILLCRQCAGALNTFKCNENVLY